MQVETLFEGHGVKLGAAGPLVVALYRGASNLATLEALDAAQSALVAKHGRISTLSIIADSPTSMLRTDEAVRQRSVELGKKYEASVLGSGIVVTARGLSAVVARTFLSGFFLLSRSEMPMKTFASLADALAWIQGLPGQSTALKTELSVIDLERFAR